MILASAALSHKYDADTAALWTERLAALKAEVRREAEVAKAKEV